MAARARQCWPIDEAAASADMQRTVALLRVGSHQVASAPWEQTGLAVTKMAQKKERLAGSLVAVKHRMFPLGLLKAGPTFATATGADIAPMPTIMVRTATVLARWPVLRGAPMPARHGSPVPATDLLQERIERCIAD